MYSVNLNKCLKDTFKILVKINSKLWQVVNSSKLWLIIN
jgi:hypothetical protein